MKKRIVPFLLVGFVLLSVFVGCGRKPNNNNNNNNYPTIPTTTYPVHIPDDAFAKTMVAASLPTTTETVKAKDGTVLCEYTYQSISLVLHRPAVAERIITDFQNRVSSTREDARTAEEKARAAYNGSATWVPYLCHVTYSPVRIDHRVLSLFGNNVVYTGANHPEYSCKSVNYDMSNGSVLTLGSVLADNANMDSLRTLTLQVLSEMSEGDYLYEDYDKRVAQRFDTDPETDTSWYFSQQGLCFYFAPYEIAPYASGVITAVIPYTKLTNLLRPEFMPTSRKETQGSVILSTFANVSLESFSNIAELVTDSSAAMFMAYTEGNVQDVRISVTDKYGEYTAFAVYNLTASDGIMIQASDDMLSKMTIHYKSGSETVSAPIVR